MPHQARSGLKALSKTHSPTCSIGKQAGADPALCECSWRCRYKTFNVMLAKWCGKPVNPRSRKDAAKVLHRMLVAIDAGTFDPAGEREVLGSGQRLSDFITEWTTHYREKRGHTGTGEPAMLGVISRGKLGSMTLEQLAGASEAIEGWLDATKVLRKWKPCTWNAYHQLLHVVCQTATEWRTNDVPRMQRNPMDGITLLREVVSIKLREVRLDEPIEDALLAACEQLNRPQHQPNRTHLTWAKAADIRRRVALGEPQAVVARAFEVQPSTVNAIVKGTTWNEAAVVVGTKGTEMRRRLYAGFDMGARVGEMLAIQIKHVQWSRPDLVELPDGTTFKAYHILLPPELTKGGKTTGESEELIVGTRRLSLELDARRMALKNKPDAYLFGTESGTRQRGFRRMVKELFRLAGLDYGRDQGLVWHSTRHEFISRIAENTGDPVVAQELARHRSLKTTQGYFHVRSGWKLKAAVGLNR